MNRNMFVVAGAVSAVVAIALLTYGGNSAEAQNVTDLESQLNMLKDNEFAAQWSDRITELEAQVAELRASEAERLEAERIAAEEAARAAELEAQAKAAAEAEASEALRLAEEARLAAEREAELAAAELEAERLAAQQEAARLAAARDNARGVKPVVGVLLSDPCSRCPSINDMTWLDNSIHSVSGELTDEGRGLASGIHELGAYQRMHMEDPLNLYVVVDPSIDLIMHAPTIWIRDIPGPWIPPLSDLSETFVNRTVIARDHWHIDTGCTEAVLDTDGWEMHINTVIWHLRTNCVGLDMLDMYGVKTPVYTLPPPPAFTKEESQQYAYNQEWEQKAQSCVTLCLEVAGRE